MIPNNETFSYFPSVSRSNVPTGTVTVEDFANWIRSGAFIDPVISVRAEIERNGGNKKTEAVDKLKKSAPCVTPSGCFSSRSLDGLKSYSSLLDIDIDGIPKEYLGTMKKRLMSYPFIVFASESISQTGLFAFARVPADSQQHATIARSIQLYLALDQINVDCLIDFTRLRIVSYDPEAYFNPQATVFDPDLYLPQTAPVIDDRKTEDSDRDEYFSDEENISFAIKKAEEDNPARDGRNKFCYSFGKIANKLGIPESKAIDSAFAHCEQYPNPDTAPFLRKEAELVISRLYRLKSSERGSLRKKKFQRRTRIRMRGDGGHKSYIPTFASVVTSNLQQNQYYRESIVFQNRVHYGQAAPVVRPARLWIDGYPFARPGDRSLIMGAQKSGKTDIVTAITGATLGGSLPEELRSKIPTMGFTASPNPYGKAVVLIDTEQSQDDVYDVGLKIGRRSGINKIPGNFMHYHFRGLDISERAEAFVEVLRYAHEAYGGVFCVIIDGSIDLLKDPNNYTESVYLSTLLLQLSTYYDTPIIEIVHTNPGSMKARGHYGSEALRKVSSSVHSGWDDKLGAFHVTFPNMRKAPRDLGFFMRWDQQVEGFIRLGRNQETAAEFGKKIQRRSFLRSLLEVAFPYEIDTLPQSVLIEYICHDPRIKDELDARKLITEMFSHNLLTPLQSMPEFVQRGDWFPAQKR